MAFNVFEFATAQVKYPERRPVVYMDGATGLKINDLRKKVADGNLTDAQESKAKKEIKALETELEKSKLTFLVRGFPTAARNVIETETKEEGEKAKWSEEEITNETVYRIFAKAIVSVTSPDGEVDEQEWTSKNVRDLMDTAPQGALNRFTDDIVHVTARAVEFDQGVDVPF